MGLVRRHTGCAKDPFLAAILQEDVALAGLDIHGDHLALAGKDGGARVGGHADTVATDAPPVHVGKG